MSITENKKIMADNIKYYLDVRGISRQQLADALKFPYTTLNNWLQANTYPPIDKIEKMAEYFGITNAKLIERDGDRCSNSKALSDSALPSTLNQLQVSPKTIQEDTITNSSLKFYSDYIHNRAPIINTLNDAIEIFEIIYKTSQDEQERYLKNNITGYEYSKLIGTDAEYFFTRMKDNEVPTYCEGLMLIRVQNYVSSGDHCVYFYMHDCYVRTLYLHDGVAAFYGGSDTIPLIVESSDLENGEVKIIGVVKEHRWIIKNSLEGIVD